MFRFMIGLPTILLLSSLFTSAWSAEPTREERLAELARIWGEVKFFHPSISDDVDWDQALVETYPLVAEAKDRASYEAALSHLFSFLHDPQTHIAADDESDKANASPEDLEPGFAELENGVAQITIPHIGTLGSRIVEGNRSALPDLFLKGKDSKVLIVDLRQKKPTDSFYNRYFFTQSFKQVVSGFSSENIIMPASKRRFHSGYDAGFGSGGYYSGAVLTEHKQIKGTGIYERERPAVFIFDDLDNTLLEYLSALELAGKAYLICQNKETPVVGNTHSLDLLYGLKANIRTSEMVNADGSTGFTPSLIIQPGEEKGDEALKAALAIARGELKPKIERKQVGIAPVTTLEKFYPEMTAPDEAWRFLALAKFWNVINYFFPYKHLLDEPWDKTLSELIPIFRAADGAEAYALAVAQASERMCDSHGSVRSPALQKYFGTAAPFVKLGYVEGKVVVVYCASEVEGLEIGDVVVSIDGKTIAEKEQTLRPFISHSTEQALNRRMSSMLLAGEMGTTVKIEVIGSDGQKREVSLNRSSSPYEADFTYRKKRSQGAYKLLESGYGYMDLNYLKPEEVDAAFQQFKGAPGLIIDIRGYPKGTAWSITPHLTEEPVAAASFSRPLVMEPDPEVHPTYAFTQFTPAGGKTLYKGKIAVLINPEAISQSEHTCLFLKSAGSDVTFIGSATTGANGDVTSVTLPGQVSVTFTGHDVRHADGSQLQRKGIQPDIPVEMTLEGLRAGEDEVLQASIHFLNESLKKTHAGGQ